MTASRFDATSVAHLSDFFERQRTLPTSAYIMDFRTVAPAAQP
ncbi:hypothetical protein SAMN04488118_104306 [Epibacterium ulvae]|uniref:Uncharacterized protein n=2 Tax=Alphaproteobacteria TaxID=28211 RepID=A0A1G5QJV1_9RHOB|nr:hypothetical protein [alpha proteobacterium U95]SCZ61876.1 hypothetical protein SAMN04488118_104306 [Epibacterium ulvae]